MNNSRRDFVKKITVGTAGISLGTLSFSTEVKKSELFADHKNIVYEHFKITGNFSPVFPIPREADYFDKYFPLSEDTTVLLPAKPGKQDSFFAQLIVSELAEKYGLVLKIKKVSKLAENKNFILIGSISNPLVRNYATINNIQISAKNPGPEGYFLKVNGSGICILGSNDQGAFYGFQTLRQLINLSDACRVQFANIKDWPNMAFRGIRLNIPGPENITFYKRFISDFMAYFKYNKVIMEVNAVMRFEKHPELNAGWIELFKDMDYSRRRQSIPGPNGENGNAVHQDAGDGSILEKEQVADLVNYAAKYYIETIPEITSLPHSSYLLTRHRELAENKNSQWPDTYCPSNPAIYDLYFDVLDEYIEVMKPKMINIGHDEWRMPLDECEKCKGKDYSELFAADVTKIHKYLKDRNIRTALWGDHLLESVRGKGPKTIKLSNGYSYNTPGGLKPEIVEKEIPKDILVLNWFWKNFKGPGEENTDQIRKWGFQQIYGNFEPYINDFEKRSKVEGLLGGAPSVWSATTEFNIGKNKLYKLLGCANLLWSTHYMNELVLARNIQELVPSVRINLKGKRPASSDGDNILPIDLIRSFNALNTDKPSGIPLELLKNNNIQYKNINFELYDQSATKGLCAVVVGTEGNSKIPLPPISKSISINQDVTSLIFLHCCAHPSTNIYGHNKIHSYADTSDLLGWYKVVYDDGFVINVPIRYGVNIREWHLWGINPQTGKIDECLVEPFCNGVGTYCYEGDLINCSNRSDKEFNFFAYEWRNSRFGTGIKDVYLEGSRHFIDYSGTEINNNAIALVALSYVERRPIERVSAK